MDFTVTKPLTVTLAELRRGEVTDQQLEDAFGPNSLGIIIVDGLTEDYRLLRAKVLTNAAKLAALPKEKLAQLEIPQAYWLVGWSLGKEKLANGEPDYTKGSFYANCNFHRDSSKEEPDPETIAKFPHLKGYITSNQWPSDDLIDGFESDFKKLVNFIINVTQDVAAICDRYMTNHKVQMPANYLQNMVAKSDTTKARLLHYVAQNNAHVANSSWCGEHLDHSCLTALTSNYYMDINDKTMKEISGLAGDFGLFIRDRHNRLNKVDVPQNALAFQTGSALEQITKKKFKAVSHLVIGPKDYPNLCRNTLAVFCQPSLEERVNEYQDFASYARMIIERNH